MYSSQLKDLKPQTDQRHMNVGQKSMAVIYTVQS